MAHYVCFGGCGTVKSEPDTCQVRDCDFYGKTLSKCDCPDGESHRTVKQGTEEEDDE